MRTIFKYPLYAIGVNVIELPFGAEVKVIGQQHGIVTLWAEVHSENSPENRTFCVYGTGHDIPGGSIFVGTAFCDPFVWHVYENLHERGAS